MQGFCSRLNEPAPATDIIEFKSIHAEEVVNQTVDALGQAIDEYEHRDFLVQGNVIVDHVFVIHMGIAESGDDLNLGRAFDANE